MPPLATSPPLRAFPLGALPPAIAPPMGIGKVSEPWKLLLPGGGELKRLEAALGAAAHLKRQLRGGGRPPGYRQESPLCSRVFALEGALPLLQSCLICEVEPPPPSARAPPTEELGRRCLLRPTVLGSLHHCSPDHNIPRREERYTASSPLSNILAVSTEPTFSRPLTLAG
ncbi:hypothetical protein NDU88_004677 [Pleurodeles waltl]|uniref:Uncharacterized protein n=1 Tax=Pleurodeles waltl TaxID=8319 RepID=A0AAV7SJG0_PLEWA|nr:hypothetical protein NDU88_004677 [Pleurodeles waltl]